MFGTKHSKVNWLQETIEYKTNQLSTNIQIEMRKYKAVKYFKIRPGKVSTCSFCFYFLISNYLKQARCN